MCYQFTVLRRSIPQLLSFQSSIGCIRHYIRLESCMSTDSILIYIHDNPLSMLMFSPSCSTTLAPRWDTWNNTRTHCSHVAMTTNKQRTTSTRDEQPPTEPIMLSAYRHTRPTRANTYQFSPQQRSWVSACGQDDLGSIPGRVTAYRPVWGPSRHQRVQWLQYVPPYLMFNDSVFRLYSVFMCFVWISE